MEGDVRVERDMDLRGLLCPIPVVKLAQAIKEVEVGTVIRATATDPGVLADIPAWCKVTGHELVDITRQESEVIFIVKRVR